MAVAEEGKKMTFILFLIYSKSNPSPSIQIDRRTFSSKEFLFHSLFTGKDWKIADVEVWGV